MNILLEQFVSDQFLRSYSMNSVNKINGNVFPHFLAAFQIQFTQYFISLLFVVGSVYSYIRMYAKNKFLSI